MAIDFAAAALALAVERLIGYPRALQRTIRHPVQWMGALLAYLERRLNDPTLVPNAARWRGMAALALLVVVAGAAAYAVATVCRAIPLGWIFEAVIATSLLAQKSLDQHVMAVAVGLRDSLAEGRNAVSRIVGRDPQALDGSGIANAALESLAENTSDGIVAPLFYFLLFGLPGAAIYKAINTADSMIGHRNDRYEHFGWAAARLDDAVNLPASRLTALLFAAAAAWDNPKAGSRALLSAVRDARHHRSPNAGWPEAALAGALGISLGGPRTYGGSLADLPRMGDGRQQLSAEDIGAGLRLYRATLTLVLIALITGALVL